VRALLDLMRENWAVVHDLPGPLTEALHQITLDLKILHPVRGDKELVRLANVELNKLRRG